MPKLCVINGDGIGREVIPAAVTILQAVFPDLETVSAEAGWDCFLQHGVSVPPSTLTKIRDCGAALFGAVQSPSHKVAGYRSAILTMRQELDLYANIRPVISLPNVSPRTDLALTIFRENTEGMYAGRERMEMNGEVAIAERLITRRASRRIAEKALEIAQQQGRKRLTIVHKANVLPLTDGLFRDSVREVVKEYAERGFTIEVDELLVDVAALKLIEEPTRFDLIITTNLFGDILSDLASYWGGGLGYAPSLNWGAESALAEPVHGSAPDIAGKGIANPTAAILSATMLARHVWGEVDSADLIERAVRQAYIDHPELSERRVGITQEVTSAILDNLTMA